jgi:uncharacterized protein (DUF1330 family)
VGHLICDVPEISVKQHSGGLMKSYIIANYSIDPNKADEYAKYPYEAVKTTIKYGGRVLVATKDSNAIEGNPENITVVLEFNSRADAERWYTSEEYSAIKNIRIDSIKAGWLLLADEFRLP